MRKWLMTSKPYSIFLVGLITSLLTAPAAGQDLGACPAVRIMAPGEVAASWEATRDEEMREGIVRAIELAADWDRTPSYVIERASQNGSNEISTVRQSGPWRRIDQTRGRSRDSEFINLETGVRVVLRRSEFGGHPTTTFEATRPHSRDLRRWHLTETRRRETHLGERCTVSRFDPVGPLVDLGGWTGPTEICTTRDGIELWRRTESPAGMNNGAPSEHLVTTRLSREPVSLDDVRPPREMLTWDYWRQHADAVARSIASDGQTARGNASDYIACYQNADHSNTREERMTDAWGFTQLGTNAIRVFGPGLGVDFWTADGGQPRFFSARAWHATELSNPFRTEFIAGGVVEDIAGERCVWQTAEFVIDGGVAPSWCVTSDDVVLATRPLYFEAVTLHRGDLSPDAFEPQDAVFSWIDAR